MDRGLSGRATNYATGQDGAVVVDVEAAADAEPRNAHLLRPGAPQLPLDRKCDELTRESRTAFALMPRSFPRVALYRFDTTLVWDGAHHLFHR